MSSSPHSPLCQVVEASSFPQMMAARYELEATITSATDLKNVNWRNGQLKPYAVVYVEPETKCATYSCADGDGGASYRWDQKLLIPFSAPVFKSIIHVDVIHDSDGAYTDPLIGSASISLSVVDFGRHVRRTLPLIRPSGRPQGKVEIKFSVRRLPESRKDSVYYRGSGSGVGAVAGAFGGLALTDDFDVDYYDDIYGYDDIDEWW